MGYKTKIKALIKKAWAKRNWDIQVKCAVEKSKQCALAPSYYAEDNLRNL